MACNAISDLAETREVDKKPFFEERRDGILDITRFCELPQLLDDFRGIGCGGEEVRQHTEATYYLALEGHAASRRVHPECSNSSLA
jgi:hypothetical protein